MTKKTGSFGSRRKTTDPIANLATVVGLARSALDSFYAADTFPAQCWWRNTAVHYAAEELGIPSRLVLGGMFYQAGSGADDIIVFGDQDVRPVLPGLFHVWAEVGDHLVDITSPYWDTLDDYSGLQPVNWEQRPPDVIAIQRSRLKPWRTPTRILPPGSLWYGNRSEPLREQVLGAVSDLLPLLRTLVRNHREAAA